MLIGGLDLGKQSDPSAFAVLDTTLAEDRFTHEPRQHYVVRYLKRWPLGTDYHVIVEELRLMYQRPPLLGTRLGIDYGNAGTAVVEMFVMAQVMADITAILLTGGYGMGGGKEGVHVSKVQLVGVLISLLSGRRIKIVPVLSESKQLRKELEGFQVKITRALNESFEAAKERIHDDLVIALALAGYIGEVIGMMSCGGVTDVRITPPKQPHETYPDRRELQIVGKRNMPQLRWNLWG